VPLAPLAWLADDTQERASAVGHERDSSIHSGTSSQRIQRREST
jgi:hypothetical protein